MNKNQINDGGPVFPRLTELKSDHRGYAANTTFEAFTAPGISLRDWFAGQALLGLVGSFEASSVQDVADTAYQYADAMLRARETGR